MIYKTEIVDYSLKTAELAEKIEAKANEMYNKGYTLISSSCTAGNKAILVFKSDDILISKIKE